MGGYQAWEYDGMVGMPPYRNHAQATPPTRGQYCKKSYVGGNHIYKKRETGWLPPSPPLLALHL